MIPDLVLALLFLGLVALVAWALNKRSDVLSQKPKDNIVPVFESPIVLPVETPVPVEAPVDAPVEAPQDALPAEAVAAVVEQPKPKNKGGRPKKVVDPTAPVAPKATRRKKAATPDTAA